MKQDERAPFVAALERARVAAYPPGEYVEQESFMLGSEIVALAAQAGISRGVSVLDLCCGVAGPGRSITRELGCSYLGVDLSSSAIEIARARARGLPCRFEVGRIPPVPRGPFDVVLLLETLLAFPDKEPLLEQVSSALTPGGRFAFTIEEGRPLTDAERERMPDADTVWLMPLDELLACLERVGLAVGWQEDHSQPHRAVADSLIEAFAADARDIAAQIGDQALDDLLAAHRLWSDWLSGGTGPQAGARRSQGLSVAGSPSAPRVTPAHVSPLARSSRLAESRLRRCSRPIPRITGGALRELDVPVVDDLDLVAPRVEKVEPRAGKDLDAALFQDRSRRGLVVDHETEVARLVGRLGTSFAEREELISQVDEGHAGLAVDRAQFEYFAVELERRLEVVDLERDVVDPDEVRAVGAHGADVSAQSS